MHMVIENSCLLAVMLEIMYTCTGRIIYMFLRLQKGQRFFTLITCFIYLLVNENNSVKNNHLLN